MRKAGFIFLPLLLAVGLVAVASPENPPAAHTLLQPDVAQLQARAKAGDAAAQLDLGKAYESGNGVPKNDGEAVKWYRLAAEQG
ncbi:MAG TPA: SEL1-like repeat protein, partial [Terracidiphilus sp.]|nr:SEL1-like repeat protein [Terracidiphilus sp.]